MDKIKVNGVEYDKEQVYWCFKNIITRLTVEQYKKLETDLRVIDKALKNMV